MIFFLIANGQNNYAEAMKMGDDEFNKKEYKKAINLYLAAGAFDPSKKDITKNKINRVFDKVDTLRIDADNAKKQAVASLNQVQRFIKAFNFYAGRFTVAFKNDKFYFMDKNGVEVEKLLQWDKLLQFDSTGTATGYKYSSDNKLDISCLIDTFGNVYSDTYETIEKKFPAKSPNRKNLDTLDLSNNALIILSEEIGELKNLRSLNLRLNELKKLPKESWELKNLTNLNLAYNELESLPEEVGQLKNLASLNLYANELTGLPKEIKTLKNLTTLFLGSNKLDNVPNEIFELKNLTVLDLSEIQLTSLPGQIGELKKLTVLALGGNSLTNLPKEIGELKNLTELNLRLTKIPQTEIQKIKELLPNCKILY